MKQIYYILETFRAFFKKVVSFLLVHAVIILVSDLRWRHCLVRHGKFTQIRETLDHGHAPAFIDRL